MYLGKIKSFQKENSTVYHWISFTQIDAEIK